MHRITFGSSANFFGALVVFWFHCQIGQIGFYTYCVWSLPDWAQVTSCLWLVGSRRTEKNCSKRAQLGYLGLVAIDGYACQIGQPAWVSCHCSKRAQLGCLGHCQIGQTSRLTALNVLRATAQKG
jgi:hypothetical protein